MRVRTLCKTQPMECIEIWDTDAASVDKPTDRACYMRCWPRPCSPIDTTSSASACVRSRYVG